MGQQALVLRGVPCTPGSSRDRRWAVHLCVRPERGVRADPGATESSSGRRQGAISSSASTGAMITASVRGLLAVRLHSAEDGCCGRADVSGGRIPPRSRRSCRRGGELITVRAVRAGCRSLRVSTAPVTIGRRPAEWVRAGECLPWSPGCAAVRATASPRSSGIGMPLATRQYRRLRVTGSRVLEAPRAAWACAS